MLDRITLLGMRSFRETVNFSVLATNCNFLLGLEGYYQNVPDIPFLVVGLREDYAPIITSREFQAYLSLQASIYLSKIVQIYVEQIGHACRFLYKTTIFLKSNYESFSL